MKYYPVFKKKEILSFVTTWMKLQGSKTERERQILHGFTYMWILKKKKVKLTETE